MRKNGILRYVVKNRIPIAVDVDSLDVDALKRDVGGSGDILPLITWRKPLDKITVYGAGGQHRYKALLSLNDACRTQIKGLERDLNTMRNEKGSEEGIKELEKQIRELKGVYKGLGMWGFAVYDYSKRSWHF